MSNAMNKDGAITPLTEQQVYDFALFGLRKQAAKAFDSETQTCLYRTSSGNACGIGQSLPDAVDTRGIDGSGSSGIQTILDSHGERGPLGQFKILFKDCNIDMLETLQQIHDQEEFPNQKWEVRMKRAAEEFNLVYTPL